MIDIVIPVYNQSRFLFKCLKSIKKQTFQDFTVTVINDGSTDDIESVLANIQLLFFQTPLKVIHQKNQGAAAARNRGAEVGKGQYLFFCDADAILKPYALETFYKIAKQNPNVSYVYSSFRYGWKKFKLFPFSPSRLRHMPYIHTMSLIKRSDFCGFDENLKRFQDWDFYLTLLEQGKVGIWIPHILFRIHPRGHISTWLPRWIIENSINLKKVIEYHEAKSIIMRKHKL